MKYLSILLTVTLYFFPISIFGQEITEAMYLKLDSALWTQYEQDMNEIYAAFKKYPDKKDSLTKISDEKLEIVQQKNRELAIKFASVPSGLRRLFMVRLGISKDTLRSVLTKLPDNLKNSPYSKSILYHIQSEQIKENDKYYDFEAVTADDNTFTLSSLKGKNILLLYGGLGCMGKEGRDFLNSLYAETSRNDFEIIVYCNVSDIQQLKNERERFPCDFPLVSDFLLDHSPVKILYGAQATPTCFFINKQGIVEMKTIGLYQNKVKELSGF